MTAKLKNIISEYSGLPDEQITPNLNLKACMLNSFQMMSMVSQIEDEFDIEISEYKIADFNTLQDLEDYLCQTSMA